MFDPSLDDGDPHYLGGSYEPHPLDEYFAQPREEDLLGPLPLAA